MKDTLTLLRSLPPEIFETPKPGDAWARSPLSTCSDDVLVQAVAESIACPKVEINSSFLLHAPLELLARAWHLAQVPPARRERARRRVAQIAATYANEGYEIEPKRKEYASVDHALSALRAALAEGDADTVDSAMLFLAPRVAFERLRAALADPLLPSLGAAAHAPILLMMLAGAPGPRPAMIGLLRSPLRAIALESDQQLTWMETAGPPERAAVQALFERLATLPPRVASVSTSIAPTMLAVERDGYAHGMLASASSALTALEAERILLRVAALSMLQDDPAHAPYGWTHCFTLPQAILSLADEAADITRVVRIAATHVLGFRATLGRANLQYLYLPEGPIDGRVLPESPREAAAAALNADIVERESIKAQLIERAAAHPDAHLAKYTMACLIAAERNPDDAALYLAAAAYLSAWWEDGP